MGRLHGRLATHPAASPTLEPGAAVCDLAAARDRFKSLVLAYERMPRLGEFETWALQAVRERQAVLGDVERILASLPQLTAQVMHRETDLVLAYRDANPKVPADDLLFSLRVGCAAKLCSAFPLSAPVERPHLVDAGLEAYARARHEAALMLLDRLPVLEAPLRDTLSPS